MVGCARVSYRAVAFSPRDAESSRVPARTAHRVVFDATGFMLHFVYSPEYPPLDASLSSPSWEAAVGALRASLPDDALDAWTWNRVVFWADDGLDAFVDELAAAGARFATRDSPADASGAVVRSLILASDGGLVYEIRALAAGSTSSVPWDVCHPVPARAAGTRAIFFSS